MVGHSVTAAAAGRGGGVRAAAAPAAAPRRRWAASGWRVYGPFVAPAVVIIAAVIVFPLGLHPVDEPAAVDHRRGDLLRRVRQLRPPARRSALRRGARPDAPLHRPRRGAAARHRRRGGDGLQRPLSPARLPARAVRHADDGDAGRDRPRLGDDVPPAARRPQLPALPRRHSAAALGLRAGDGDPVARHGRDVAVVAARHARRPRRPRRGADGALRGARRSTGRTGGRCSATSPCR